MTSSSSSGTRVVDSLPSQRAATAAVVAAELLDVSLLARGLSLVAKNARTLVAGTGDQTRALGVIAEHFSELADKIIALTKSIGASAISLSRESVVGWRCNSLCEHLISSINLAQDARYLGTLDVARCAANDARDVCRSDLRLVIKKMNMEVSVLYDCMRTSEVISVSFLLEASQAGQNETQLIGMADKINSISKAIREKLKSSKSFL